MIANKMPVPPAMACLLALMAILASGVGRGSEGQETARLRVAENLRVEPRGAILGRLMAGASFPVVSRSDLWVEVAVEGWMWTPSLQTTDRGGFDLAVSASPTENLRAEPQGDVVAVLAEGTLLEELDAITGWKRVRRVAWVWGESVAVEDEASSPEPSVEEPTPETGGRGPDEGWWRSGPGGAPVLSVPDGDTLARARPGADLQVLAREGSWVRVRLEGWVWAPQTEEAAEAPEGVAAGELTPAEVAQSPGAYRGRVVSWDLQFVSLERAEKIRTDFYEGEPFLLTRTSTSAGAFVYVAVPPERLGELEGLVPLERIRVVGRIRTGAAALTGNPILDLLELTRISRD